MLARGQVCEEEIKWAGEGGLFFVFFEEWEDFWAYTMGFEKNICFYRNRLLQ